MNSLAVGTAFVMFTKGALKPPVYLFGHVNTRLGGTRTDASVSDCHDLPCPSITGSNPNEEKRKFHLPIRSTVIIRVTLILDR